MRRYPTKRIPPGVKRHPAVRMDETGRLYTVIESGGQFAPKSDVEGGLPHIDPQHRWRPPILRWDESKGECVETSPSDEHLRQRWQSVWKWWKALWKRQGKQQHLPLPDEPPSLDDALEKLYNLCTIARRLVEPIKAPSALPRDVILCADHSTAEEVSKELEVADGTYLAKTDTVAISPRVVWKAACALASPPEAMDASWQTITYAADVLIHELMHGKHYTWQLLTGERQDEMDRAIEDGIRYGMLTDDEVSRQVGELLVKGGVILAEGIATLGTHLCLRALSQLTQRECKLRKASAQQRYEMQNLLRFIASAPDKPQEIAEVVLSALGEPNTTFMTRLIDGIAKVYGVSPETLNTIFHAPSGAEFIRTVVSELGVYRKTTPKAPFLLVELMRQAGKMERHGKVTPESCEHLIQDMMAKREVEYSSLHWADDVLFDAYLRKVAVKES